VKKVFTSNWYISRVCLPSYKEAERDQGRRRELNVCLAQTEISKMPALIELLLRNSSFEELFADAVDEALSSLGNSCKQAIYFHLEKTFKIKKCLIPYKIEQFASALEEIFGFGSKFLEIKIMECLYQKAGHFKYFPRQQTLEFTKYIEALRRNLTET